MNLDPLFRLKGPFLHLLVTSDSDAFNLAWSFQRTGKPGCVARVLRGHKAATTQGFFDEIAAALQFPPYFGENWNALDECLTDLEWLPAEAYILVVIQAARLLEKEPDQRPVLLGCLDGAAQEWSKSPGNQRPPRPFHVLLTCRHEEVKALTDLLQSGQAAWDTLHLAGER